jgi:hypothetical protein
MHVTHGATLGGHSIKAAAERAGIDGSEAGRVTAFPFSDPGLHSPASFASDVCDDARRQAFVRAEGSSHAARPKEDASY